MSTVSTKIYLQPTNLIRRFQINSNDLFVDFDRLVREAFGIVNSEQQYTWQYQDDENDWVSFSSEGEWRDALFYHAQSDNKILRLKLIQQQQEGFFRPRGHHHRGGPWRRPDFRHPHQVRHWGVRCDGCNQSGIVGDRYKCLDCDDFDFCGTCYNSNKLAEHGNHKFEKIERPRHGRRHNFFNNCGFKSFQDGNGDTVFHCPMNADMVKQFGGNVQQAQQALSNIFGKFGVDVEIATEEPKPQPAQQEQPKEEKPVEEPVPEPEPQPVIAEPQPVVEAPKVEVKPVLLPEPAYEEVEPFAEQLETLRVMGFENVSLNKHLLSNYKGDLTRVVNSLLQLSQFRQ